MFWYQDFDRFTQVFVHYMSFFNDMQTTKWWNVKDKGHLFTLNFPMTATKIHRIYLLRTFFFIISLDKSVLLHRRCLMSKFPEILILLCRKIFSVFYPIFHETFSNSCGFALIWEFNPFSRIWSPHTVLYYRKHFYSTLTNLSNLSHSKSSIVPFAKFWSEKRSHKTLSNKAAVR